MIMTDYTQRENVIKKMIEQIVIPKYPELELSKVFSEFRRGVRVYIVTLNNYSDYDLTTRAKINEEIKTLFKMASLDEKSINGRDQIFVTFQT